MKFTDTPLAGLKLIEPQVFGDSRGYFYENYSSKKFSEAGIVSEFKQDNISKSSKGVLRGLHYQLAPFGQAKLVQVILGEVFDVAVDIRKGSPTYGKWHGEILSAENKKSFFVPVGFAHGFLVLSDYAHFIYKCSELYHPEAERSIAWDDTDIGIDWPFTPDPALISEKDKQGTAFKDAEINYSFA